MGVPGPFPSFAGAPDGPVMGREEVDRALAKLAAEHEAIESSLLALQDHAGRRLLEGAELTGVTKNRWSTTEQAISLLWSYFDAYTEALTRAREVRSRHRWPTQDELAELTELLCGTAITLPSSATLGGSPLLSEELGLDRLVDRMNRWYAEALDVI
ncbi:hypothetical protein JBE27_25705, partial [Streptomyces albiflaviniger]|nr:hypothetical protein [Streptomyces albiflaviniger]